MVRGVNHRPYWRMFGAVTAITGIWLVVNHILPYFDGRLRPSYGSIT